MMNVLAIGNGDKLKELKEKFQNSINLSSSESLDSVNHLSEYDIIFDFDIAEFPENYLVYMELDKTIVFLNTVKLTLAELSYTFGSHSAEIYGFNGLSSLINRDVLELSSIDGKISDKLKGLNWNYELVDDRVGLVTPRIILMIINEAFYTVQEGTASREDIDLGMKLGTNYPYGPFEWLDLIGIQDVYETLEAIYEDTKDERYKIAPLLKKEYLLY